MKTFLIILILTEAFIAVMAFSPMFIDRNSAAQDFIKWRNNPTPENEAAWQKENAKTIHVKRVTEFFVWSLLGLNSIGIFALVHRINKQRTV